ncbi:MAG: TetR/AcrR family transcriptional regulator [Halioglobus sp.]|nr:TetR/AcrR family transcriptional regulator [Halioglobus sp.]
MKPDILAANGSSTSPFNRSAQRDLKRIAILSQAARLFNYKGSRATTLHDVAKSLGLTKTSLYYYVKNKEDLIYQCYIAALELHHKNLDEIEKQHAGALERASSYFLQHFENWLAAQEDRAPHVAALLEIAALKGDYRKHVESSYIRLFKRLREYIRQGIAEGCIRDCEPTSTTRAILGSVEWTFSWLHSIPREKVRTNANEALDIITNGICAGNAPHSPAKVFHENKESVYPQDFSREEKNRLKQQAFFRTGTRFFNTQGFTGTSLDEIAEHLHVSKGAFYYQIKNKEDLLFHCYNLSLDIIEEIHAQSPQFAGTGLQKAEMTCLRIFYIQNSDEGPLIRYNTITALPMKRRRQILKRTDKNNENFGAFLNEGITDGSIRPINTLIAQHLITGARNAAMDIKRWRKVDNIDDAAIDYFDVFFNGLAPRKKI